MKIKLIDLFNKMVKEEDLPKKIKHNKSIFELDTVNAYYCYDTDCDATWLSNELVLNADELNTEAEIIKDKKMEKIKTQYFNDEIYTPEKRLDVCMNYIDKLVDEINDLKEK